MKKIIKGAICAGLALTMCAAVGCKKQKLDPENRQLLLSIGALDGNFNPFTYTSANDGEMIGMTQLPLVTIDDDGNVVYGENEVCAALDMTTTMYTAKEGGSVTTDGSRAERTEYRITLKKGIMFSDGKHELTINDVLFNLYVYLDPAYTGSTTIYSTDIQGLKAYRLQDPNASDDSSLNIDSRFTGSVDARIYNITEWSAGRMASNAQIESDVALAKNLFAEEVDTDWSSIYAGWEESYKAYRFTEAWQAFLFAEGLVQVQTRLDPTTNTSVNIFEDKNGDGIRQDDELYYTTLDPYQTGAVGSTSQDVANGKIEAEHFYTMIEEATTDAKIADYQASHSDVSREDAILALQKEACVERVYANYTTDGNIGMVVTGWATASTLYDEILGQLRTEYYQQLKENNNGLLVKSISGITTEKTANGNDVLVIKINGVDPKAQFNWGFPIAPMYYYSDSGSYNGKDYVSAANGVDEFGLEFGDSDFFNNVISSTEKNGVPVGAGAYQATTRTGGDNPTRETFNANTSNCYFKRNEYFYTVGQDISNAKIKYVNYKVYSDAKIMEALQKGEIDFGKPNATRDNVNLVSQNSDYLAQETYQTGGYGYIGVNPKYVPEYKVRQAIMKAINTSTAVTEYYSRDLAETIYRPMSKTSWAYPRNATQYESVKFDITGDEITQLVREAGYTRTGNSVYRKTTTVDGMSNAAIGDTLKFTFTIAGESTDHPAYRMFTEAANKLNALGFDITVTTDPNALKSLTSGNLAVWAAAWTSSTDPDMYQIYHMDSTATSVNNWNYKNILNDQQKWSYEYGIIKTLSDKIDEGRSYLERQDRVPVYAECLDLIMDLAVELPTYQRCDLCVYNKNVINSKTLHYTPNYNIGLFDKIWEINYV